MVGWCEINTRQFNSKKIIIITFSMLTIESNNSLTSSKYTGESLLDLELGKEFIQYIQISITVGKYFSV
jgi:hypothetical protein